MNVPIASAPVHMFNASTTFRRTNQGTEESRNRNSQLPQRLKSILLLVDCRSLVSRFLETLTVYGDVSELFQVLLDLAMIEPMAVLPNGDRSPSSPKKENFSARPAEASMSDRRHALEIDAAAPPTARVELAAPSAPAFTPNPSALSAAGITIVFQNNNSGVNLKRALNQVNDWIPDLFGADAMEIMLELEKCADKAQLVATVTELTPMMNRILGASETDRRLGLLNEIFSGRA